MHDRPVVLSASRDPGTACAETSTPDDQGAFPSTDKCGIPLAEPNLLWRSWATNRRISPPSLVSGEPSGTIALPSNHGASFRTAPSRNKTYRSASSGMNTSYEPSRTAAALWPTESHGYVSSPLQKSWRSSIRLLRGRASAASGPEPTDGALRGGTTGVDRVGFPGGAMQVQLPPPVETLQGLGSRHETALH